MSHTQEISQLLDRYQRYTHKMAELKAQGKRNSMSAVMNQVGMYHTFERLDSMIPNNFIDEIKDLKHSFKIYVNRLYQHRQIKSMLIRILDRSVDKYGKEEYRVAFWQVDPFTQTKRLATLASMTPLKIRNHFLPIENQ